MLEVITAAYLSAQERREVDLPLTAEPDYERLFRSLPARIPPRQRPNPRSVPND